LVVRHSIKEQVCTIIKERILRGEYATGSTLNIAQLTTELGVSNTPLREALSWLESEGLVVRSSKRYQVISFSDKLNEDLNQVSSIQALGALELCVQFGKLDELAVELRRAFDEQLRAYGSDDYYEYLCKTTEFDRAIVKAAGNDLLLSMFEASALFLTLATSTKHRGKVEKNIQEHQEILTAIENADIALARSLIKTHYDKPLSKYPA